MKISILAVAMVLIPVLAFAQTRPRVRQIPAPPPVQSGNIFGTSHSGVAPSTAIREQPTIYAVPAPRGAGTGGTND